MTETTFPRGVVSPNLTPFNDDGSIATDLYTDHALRLLDQGCAGLAPFGTTGEALSLGIDERIEALDALIAAGVDPALMMPGTGLTSVADTARLSRACLERGCAGVMVLPPFYFKGVPDEGLVAYFEALISAIGLPSPTIYLYHIPQVAGVGIPPAVVRTLRQRFPNAIVGIKDSSGDTENTRALFGIDGLTVYPGTELLLMEALDQGGPGCISATANVNATAIAEVVRLYDRGDVAAARSAFERVQAFRLLVQGYAPIPAQKWLIARSLGDPRWINIRPPLMPMDETAGQKLADELQVLTGTSIRAA